MRRDIAIALTFALTPWLCLAQATDAASAPAQSASAQLAPPFVAALSKPRPAALSHATTSPLLPLPAWQSLSPAQKAALQPLANDWNQLDDFRKGKWLEVAARYPALPAAEQARLQERMRDWARMSPAERQQARMGFQDAQQLKPDARQAKWESYQALTPEQRQALADKAAKKQATGKPTEPTPASQQQAKSNLIPAASKGLPARSVAPSVVQAKSGASTMLINQTLSQPAHQQAGQTKVFADPSLVDSKTLLPKRAPVKAAAPPKP